MRRRRQKQGRPRGGGSAGTGTHLGIERQHRLEPAGSAAGEARELAFDHAGDGAEAEPPVEEGRDRDLVGGVEDGRGRPARPGGGAGQLVGSDSGSTSFRWQYRFETILPFRSCSPCVANQFTTWLR